MTAQINGTGTVAARALQIPFELGVWIGLAGILTAQCSAVCGRLLGQGGTVYRADYAYLIPVFWMSNKLGYGLIPHFAQFVKLNAFRNPRLLGVAL